MAPCKGNSTQEAAMPSISPSLSLPLPWSTTVSPCLSLRPLVYYCLHLPLPSPPLSVSFGPLMFPPASPCFHSVPHIRLALFWAPKAGCLFVLLFLH